MQLTGHTASIRSVMGFPESGGPFSLVAIVFWMFLEDSRDPQSRREKCAKWLKMGARLDLTFSRKNGVIFAFGL